MGLLAGGLLFFVSGLLAGLAALLWMPLPLEQANLYSHIWWLDLFTPVAGAILPIPLLLVLGALLLVISFIRSEEKPILPSVMMAYGLYLPLNAAGFGLGSGVSQICQDGLMASSFTWHWQLY